MYRARNLSFENSNACSHVVRVVGIYVLMRMVRKSTNLSRADRGMKSPNSRLLIMTVGSWQQARPASEIALLSLCRSFTLAACTSCSKKKEENIYSCTALNYFLLNNDGRFVRYTEYSTMCPFRMCIYLIIPVLPKLLFYSFGVFFVV